MSKYDHLRDADICESCDKVKDWCRCADEATCACGFPVIDCECAWLTAAQLAADLARPPSR